MTKTRFGRAVQLIGLLLIVIGTAAAADQNSEVADEDNSVSAESWHQRPLVKKWKVEDLADDVEKDLSGRSLRRGRAVYNSARCIQCHQVDGKGGKFGAKVSDLTMRFTGRKLLQHILDPSLDIAKGYETQVFVTRDGRVATGFVAKDTKDTVHILANPNHPEETVIVRKADVEERHKSAVSTMPAGALYSFNRTEILDLMAFIQSEANSD